MTPLSYFFQTVGALVVGVVLAALLFVLGQVAFQVYCRRRPEPTHLDHVDDFIRAKRGP